jgi:hypothetical protein
MVKAVDFNSSGTAAACTRVAAWAGMGSARRATRSERKTSKNQNPG